MIIEFIVLLILVVFFVLIAMPLFSSVPLFLINATIIILVAIRANTDIKQFDMLLHYLIAAFITVFIFVAQGAFKSLFGFMDSILVLEVTQALIYIFFIAHIIRLAHEGIKKLIAIQKTALKQK